MSNHWILGEIAKSYAQEEREEAVRTDQYDQLLAEIQDARLEVRMRTDQQNRAAWYLEALLKRLDTEEHRLAREALTSMHSASRKLVVSE